MRSINEIDLDLERDLFLRSLVRELAGTLEEIVGPDDASGYISLVGQRLGRMLNTSYTAALGVERLDAHQVGEVLVDLKRRIQGEFFVISEEEGKIVLGGRKCPFGDQVHGRPSICALSANIFGVIAAENLGYARVEQRETIARGFPGCRIEIHLRPEASAAGGCEYFGEPPAEGAYAAPVT